MRWEVWQLLSTFKRHEACPVLLACLDIGATAQDMVVLRRSTTITPMLSHQLASGFSQNWKCSPNVPMISIKSKEGGVPLPHPDFSRRFFWVLTCGLCDLFGFFWFFEFDRLVVSLPFLSKRNQIWAPFGRLNCSGHSNRTGSSMIHAQIIL